MDCDGPSVLTTGMHVLTLVTHAKPIKFISDVWHLSFNETCKRLPIVEVSVSAVGQASIGTREDDYMGAGGPDSSSHSRSQSTCQQGRLSESCCKEIRNVLIQPGEEQALYSSLSRLQGNVLAEGLSLAKQRGE